MSKEKHHRNRNHRSINRIRAKKTEQIVEFCLLIRALIPEEVETIQPNESYNHLLLELPIEERKLAKLLMHHLAKLYQHHRVQRRGKIIEIAEEDILTSFTIIEHLIQPDDHDQKLSRQAIHHYQTLLKHQNQLLTRSEIEKHLNLSKTQTNDLLNQLIEQKLVIRYGFSNKGYRYQILDIQEEAIKQAEPSIEEEIKEDFTDNQRIDYGYR